MMPFYEKQKAPSTQDGQHPRPLDLATDWDKTEQVWDCWGHTVCGLVGYPATFIGSAAWFIGDKHPAPSLLSSWNR